MSGIRVLHVLPALTGYGAEKQVAALLPRLQSPDLTAGVLTIYRMPQPEVAAEAPFPVLDGGRARRCDYTFLHRLVAKMRAFDPDIVHAHTHAGKYWARAAAAIAGVPHIVYTEHNPCDPRRSPFERVVDPWLHLITDRVVTFFSEQRMLLARRDRIPVDKIVTIPNGLPLDGEVARTACLSRPALTMRADRFAVVIVGRLEYQKNQQLALRALASLDAASQRGIHFYFAGAGADEDALRALARDLDVAEHVSFLGYRSDVRDIIAASDVLLMTSHFEGMPLVLIEAMLAGTAIVTTPWTGASEMLDGGRFGFIARDWEPQAVAETLARALLSYRSRAAMVLRAREYAADAYSLARTAQRHRQLYFDLALACAS